MKFALYLLPFCIGCLIPLQAALNNSLRDSIGSGAMFAAFISFAIGTIALAIGCVVAGEKWMSVVQLPGVPPWQFAGGLIGAVFVFGATLLVPRIGLANLLSLTIAGQIAAALVFDRVGILGLAIRDINAPRIIGAVLVLAGVLLVNYGDRWR